MASQSRKYRGYESQKLVAEALRGLWPLAEPTGAGRQGKDILGIPDPFCPEVKARAGLDIPAWLRQAKTEAAKKDEYAVLIIRLNGQGPASIDDWPVLMTLGQWKKLVREAGYGVLGVHGRDGS